MKKLYSCWAGVIHGLLRYDAPAVIVLLTVDGIDRSDYQAQAAPSAKLSRHESETVEVIALRLLCRDKFLRAKTFSITRPHPVRR